MTDRELLILVTAEATKFGRCCDLYQDGFGTFADTECQQRTFAMLRDVQAVLGVDKGGTPLSAEETNTARARARLNNAAPDLLAALREAEDYFDDRADAEYHTDSPQPTGNEEMRMLVLVRAAITKASRGTP